MSIFHSSDQLILQRDILGHIWMVARQKLSVDNPTLGMKDIMSWWLW